jgi:hypothetical protein
MPLSLYIFPYVYQILLPNTSSKYDNNKIGACYNINDGPLLLVDQFGSLLLVDQSNNNNNNNNNITNTLLLMIRRVLLLLLLLSIGLSAVDLFAVGQSLCC